MVASIRYLDEFVKQDGQWLFAERRWSTGSIRGRPRPDDRAGTYPPGPLDPACAAGCGSRPARTASSPPSAWSARFEPFYDLAVVVLVGQDAHRLAGHLTWPGLGQFTVVFTLVWIAWTNGSLHHELHGREDARGRSTFLLQILVLAAMGAFIPQVAARAGQRSPSPRRCCSRYWPCCGCWRRVATPPGTADRAGCTSPGQRRAPSCWPVPPCCLLPPDAPLALLDAVYLAGFAAVTLTALSAQPAALTVTDALIDRFGTLILIVLGETLTGVVTGLAAQPVSGLTLSVGLVAVVVGFGAWWTYFDLAGHRHPRPERTASLQWMLGHLPLTAAIAAMGAAMVSLGGHAHDARIPAATACSNCPRAPPRC